MKDDQKQTNVSKRIVIPTLRYLDKTVGPEITDKILLELGHPRVFFEDENGYMSIEVVDELFNIASKHTGDPDFAYTMGRNLIVASNKAQLFFMAAFASPQMLYKHLDKIENRLVQTTKVKVDSLDRNRFRMTVSFENGYKEPYSACRNRHGTYESIPTMFGMPHARVVHSHCAFRGDPHCVYEVTIPDTRDQLQQIISVLATLLSCLTVGAGIILKEHWIAVAGTFSLNLSLIYLLFKIRNQLNSLTRWKERSKLALEAQTVNLTEQNAMAQRLNELAFEMNSHIDISEISTKAAESMVKLFNFEGCIVWLINSASIMYCSGSYGFNQLIVDLLQTIRYNVSDGLKKETSFIYRVIELQQTLIINDPLKETQDFLFSTRNLVQQLKPSSLVVAPLKNEKETFGMIIGVHLLGYKVSYEDKLFFESAAPIISNSLFNARMQLLMNERISQRESQISKRTKELVAAREMVIQSELNAAMGELAFNIVYELETPFHFIADYINRTRTKVEQLQTQFQTGQIESIQNTSEDEFSPQRLETILQTASSILNNSQKDLQQLENRISTFKRLLQTESDENNIYCLEEIVTTVVEIINPELLQGKDLTLSIPKGLHPKIHRSDLIQVLLSLLTNALESLDKDYGSVKIEAFKQNSNIIINISDTGHGIPHEIRYDLMKPFFTTKNRSFHYGLGLTLARELIIKNSGKISFLSDYGQGSLFSIFLPEGT